MVQDFQKQRIVTCSSGLSMAANSTLKVQFNGITLTCDGSLLYQQHQQDILIERLGTFSTEV